MAKRNTDESNAAVVVLDDGILLNKSMMLEVRVKVRDPNGKTFNVRLGDFPANAIEKMLRYGVQRTFNDKIGGEDTTTEDKVANAEALIEKFKKGEIGRTVTASGIDALTKEMRKIAMQRLDAQYPDKAKALRALIKSDKDMGNAKLDGLIERTPDIRPEAEANLQKSVGDIDLGELDL